MASNGQSKPATFTMRRVLTSWLDDLLVHGSPCNDAILLAAAWRTVGGQASRRAQTLADINELALALTTSRERHLETVQQGKAFAAAIEAAWPCQALAALAEVGEPTYPVAVGVAAAGHGLDLNETVSAYVLAFICNLVSAAVRLGPIGQTDGQKTIASLLARCQALAVGAAASSLDDLGTAAFRSDLASFNHETQYTRLFRS